MAIYKVFCNNGRLHLWEYESFKEETKATVRDFSVDANLINYIIYQTPEPVSDSLFEHYNLAHILLEEFIPSAEEYPLEPIPVIFPAVKSNQRIKRYWWEDKEDD